MRLSVEIDLSDNEAQRIRTMSLERMINNAINVGGIVENPQHAISSQEREDASTLWQDFEEMKPVLMRIYHAITEEIFKTLVLQNKEVNK